MIDLPCFQLRKNSAASFSTVVFADITSLRPSHFESLALFLSTFSRFWLVKALAKRSRSSSSIKKNSVVSSKPATSASLAPDETDDLLESDHATEAMLAVSLESESGLHADIDVEKERPRLLSASMCALHPMISPFLSAPAYTSPPPPPSCLDSYTGSLGC